MYVYVCGCIGWSISSKAFFQNFEEFGVEKFFFSLYDFTPAIDFFFPIWFYYIKIFKNEVDSYISKKVSGNSVHFYFSINGN